MYRFILASIQKENGFFARVENKGLIVDAFCKPKKIGRLKTGKKSEKCHFALKKVQIRVGNRRKFVGKSTH